MKKKLKIILCEGPHDVAFINKILKTSGYTSYESIEIKNLPYPINNLIINEIKQSDIEDLNVQDLRRTLLPSNTLKKDEDYIFLYSLGGDGKKGLRAELLKRLLGYIPQKGEIIKGRQGMVNVDLNVIYSFDSDNKGVLVRLSEIEKEIQNVLPSFPSNVFSKNYSSSIFQGVTFGCQIFTEKDKDTGKLEDIVVPLMKKNNENIFESADNFIENHFDAARLYPLKIKIDPTGITETRSTKNKDQLKFDKTKSLVAIVGQLQKSGMSNVVCIGQTDYLDKPKIDQDVKCQELINFLSSL